MAIVNVPAGVTSRPHFVAAGSIVKVSPAAGASAVVEYTNSSAAGIANGVATWVPWAKGSVSAETSDIANNPVWIRVRATGAAVAFEWNTSPSAADKAAFASDWGRPLALATDGAGLLNRVGNMSGGQRMPGNSMFVSGASGLKTLNMKMEAEAPFTAVRVWIGHKPTSGLVPTWKAVVAPTETMAADTVNNAFTPIVGGTQYNALVGTTYGWRTVTWAGVAQATSSLAATSPDSSVNTCGYMVSDWIPCVSIPRVDMAGGRPAALLKIAQTDASAPYNQLNGTLATYYTNRGVPAYREWFTAQTLNDGVTTLANLPASVPAAGVAPFYAWLEYQYSVPTRSVCVVGDSTTEAANSAFQWMSWVEIAMRELSTPAAPIAVTNIAGSGHTHREYLLLLDYMLAAGFAPTDVFFQGWSQNGYAATVFSADELIARDTFYLQKLRTAGIQVWMSTSYAGGGYSPAGEATRMKCVAQVKAWAAAGLVRLVDTDSVLTEYSSGVGKLIAAYDGGDHIHANPAGHRVMADLLKSVWR